ncbi:MAG TPA: DUF1361 domain-containing protein [Polyangia bacterium]|nr:DUF1361 domain-containing protein [Polyangia bacterium]
MISSTIQRDRPALGALAAASLFCCALAAARLGYTGRGTYLFLCWNLFLAWVPLGLSLALARLDAGRALTAALGAGWLAFFPNAPYLATDLVHLRERQPVPVWFDALLLLGFALTGLGLAFLSLVLVHRRVERRLGARKGWLFVAAVAGLTGLGVYLGRFLRWNSWDLLTRPAELVAEVARWLLAPAAHLRSAAVALFFGGFFGVAYVTLRALARALRSEGAEP